MGDVSRLDTPTRAVVDLIAAAADPARRAVIAPADAATLDAIARGHLLAVLLAMVRQGRAVPGDGESPQSPSWEQFLERARQRCQSSTAIVMGLEDALVKVAGALAEAAVPFRLFKGAALAYAIYPDPSWRPYGDLDLLVRKADFARATEALAGIGLGPVPGVSVRRRLRHFNAVTFVSVNASAGGAAKVDLHWSDQSAFWSSRSVLNQECVWADGPAIQMGGVQIATLSPAVSLVQLAGHWGYHHLFGSWINLLDILLLMDRLTPDERAESLELARSCGYSRVVAMAMHLVGELVGRDTRDWLDSAAIKPRDRALAMALAAESSQPRGAWRTRRLKARVCLDGPGARVRALWTFLAAKLVP